MVLFVLLINAEKSSLLGTHTTGREAGSWELETGTETGSQKATFRQTQILTVSQENNTEHWEREREITWAHFGLNYSEWKCF